MRATRPAPWSLRLTARLTQDPSRRVPRLVQHHSSLARVRSAPSARHALRAEVAGTAFVTADRLLLRTGNGRTRAKIFGEVVMEREESFHPDALRSSRAAPGISRSAAVALVASRANARLVSFTTVIDVVPSTLSPSRAAPLSVSPPRASPRLPAARPSRPPASDTRGSPPAPEAPSREAKRASRAPRRSPPSHRPRLLPRAR